MPLRQAIAGFLKCWLDSKDECVRSAKRMANSLKVSWIAVYVENSRHFNLSEREKLIVESYFRMAKRNGADTVTLYGENAAEEILSYAKL